MKNVIEYFRVLWNFIQAAPMLIFFKPPSDDAKSSLGLMFQTLLPSTPISLPLSVKALS